MLDFPCQDIFFQTFNFFELVREIYPYKTCEQQIIFQSVNSAKQRTCNP